VNIPAKEPCLVSRDVYFVACAFGSYLVFATHVSQYVYLHVHMREHMYIHDICIVSMRAHIEVVVQVNPAGGCLAGVSACGVGSSVWSKRQQYG